MSALTDPIADFLTRLRNSGNAAKPEVLVPYSKIKAEIARILARHIRDAADLPFAPQKFVVIKSRHLVQMNGIDGHDSALAQTGQGADDDFSAGSKGHSAIELHRRLLILVANPRRACGTRTLAMRFASGHNIDFAVP